MFLLHHRHGSFQGHLCVHDIEDRLDQDPVNTAVDQCFYLFGIGTAQHLHAQRLFTTCCHGACLTGGSHRSHHISGLIRILGRILLSDGTRQGAGCQIHLAAVVLQSVVAHGDALGIEGIGLDDVGSCLQVFAMDVADDIRTGEGEQVVASFQCLVVLLETAPPEMFLL